MLLTKRKAGLGGPETNTCTDSVILIYPRTQRLRSSCQASMRSKGRRFEVLVAVGTS